MVARFHLAPVLGLLAQGLVVAEQRLIAAEQAVEILPAFPERPFEGGEAALMAFEAGRERLVTGGAGQPGEGREGMAVAFQAGLQVRCGRVVHGC